MTDEELSKLYLDVGISPEPHIAQAKRAREYEKRYYEEHAVCPQCRSRDFISTLMGYIVSMEHPETFQDKNEITCRCGWEGIRHDLVPREKPDYHRALSEARQGRVSEELKELHKVPWRTSVPWSLFPAWARPTDPEVFEGCGHEG